MPQTVSSAPSKEPILPGLLALQDTLEQHPDARKPLLAAEIMRRESQVVLLRSHRLLLRMQLWSALQTAIIAGFVIFSFGAALSGLVEVGKLVQRVGAWNATLTGNILTRGLQSELQSIIPTSTVLQVANYVPFWDLHDATRLSVLVALIILVIRVTQGVMHVKANRRLKQEANILEGELATLRQWLTK